MNSLNPEIREHNIDKAILAINNINPSIIPKIKEYCNTRKEHTFVDLTKAIREYLGINRPINRYCKDYWTLRGWSNIPPDIKKSNKRTGYSPFNYMHWVEKGYSIDDAKYKANSIRPIRKEYWMEQGFALEESIEKAKSTKLHNNKKGALASKQRDISMHRETSRRCIEYWLLYHRGDTAKAKKSLCEHQSTFSLDICIEKYGKTKGLEIWKARQNKWIGSLSSNSEDDIMLMNEKKGCGVTGFKKRYGVDWKIEYEKYLKTRNRPVIKNISEFSEYIKSNFDDSIYVRDITSFKNKIPGYLTAFIDDDELEDFYEKSFIADGEVFKVSGFYTKRSLCGKILRSSYEIKFYDMLISAGFIENTDFIIEKKYPDSNLRSDFYLQHDDLYIEICGYMDNNEYRNHMIFKEKEFGAVLVNPDEIDNFINDIRKK